MGEDLKREIMVIIVNTIRILEFIILAIFFRKWWIVLFSPFFLAIIEDRKKKGDGNK